MLGFELRFGFEVKLHHIVDTVSVNSRGIGVPPPNKSLNALPSLKCFVLALTHSLKWFVLALTQRQWLPLLGEWKLSITGVA